MITLDTENDDDKHLAFDCWQAFEGNGSWWTCHVFRLCAKADAVRTAQVELAFPREVAMYADWTVTPTVKEFMVKWGI